MTTIREYLQGQFQNYRIDDAVFKAAAVSPLLAKPKRFMAIDLDADFADYCDEEEMMNSLQYALSSLCYSMSAAFSGGSRSEQVGDVHASETGRTITQQDREYYRSLGDKIRRDLGCEVEETVQEQGGMKDFTYMRNRPRRWS